MSIVKQVFGHISHAGRHEPRFQKSDKVLRQTFGQQQDRGNHHQHQRPVQHLFPTALAGYDFYNLRRIIQRQPDQKFPRNNSAESRKKQNLLSGKIVPQKLPHRRRYRLYFHFFFLCLSRVSLSLTIAVSRPVLASRSYMRSISFSR